MTKPRTSSLLWRLLPAYLLPTLALFALFGWLAQRVAARSLEQSLGRRLCATAQAAATQLRPRSLMFLAPGDDQSRTARRVLHKLTELRDRTGAARLVVLDRKLRALADTAGTMRIGDRHYKAEADRHELDRVFSGKEASSVLFRGNDGRMYKTGYAPVRSDDQVVAAVGVAGSAEFFAALDGLRRTLWLIGAVVALLLIGISVLVARRITRPLRDLAGEASRIGAGDLEHPIAPSSRDEVGLLASTMNEMRQDLFRREQELQMMLSGIAHEVRNPLGGIELFAGLLREEVEDDPDQLEMVERIERELSYLKKVVEDFLDFARKRPPALDEVNLSELAQEVVEVLGPDAGARQVSLSAAGDSEATARADREQVRRVLLNLTRNAIQACPEGGRVDLLSGQDDAGATVRVQDNGAGMDAETLGRAFAPFFTTRQKGSGLGLALAKKIVEQHGGTLTAQSDPGQGSEFLLRLL